MHLFYTPDIATTLELPQEEAAHALRVLRLTEGDEVMLTDGKGSFYRAQIDMVSGKRCYVRIVETTTPEPLWQGHLHLAMAPTKNMDRIEWFAEKATEIGFDELTFLDCRFSERKVIKTERVEKILVSAMKQSLKPTLPVLNGMTPFNKFVAQPFAGQKFIAHCYEGDKEALMQALQPGEDCAYWSRRRLQPRRGAARHPAWLPPHHPRQVTPPHRDCSPRGGALDECDPPLPSL